MTTTTFKDIQTREITADEMRNMIAEFTTIRKNAGTAIQDLDNETIYAKFWYFIHGLARLQIPGIDPEKTTLALAYRVVETDGKKNYQTEIKFVPTDGGDALLTVQWIGKHVTVLNADGTVFAEGNWRDEVRPKFTSMKSIERASKREAKKEEKVLKKAATPVKKAAKPKKEKTTAKTVEKIVKAKKTAKKEKPIEEDVLAEVNEVLAETAPKSEPKDEIEQMIADGEPLPF